MNDVIARETTGADFLKIVPGARAVALGDSFCAVSGDVHSINDNPAGLSDVGNINLTFMHYEWMEQMDYEYFAYTHPFKNNIIGISILFFHLPKFIHFGDYGEEVGDINVSDLAVSLGYSRSIFNINFGIGAKFIYRTLYKYNAYAHLIMLF